MNATPARKPADTHFVVACTGGEGTILEARPLPVPGPGEMVLDLRVVGFCGTDLFKLKTGSAKPGTVLGHELVGEVLALGSGVKKFALGDRVVVPHHVPCGTCVYCRRRAVEFAARKIPEGIPDERAVFMEPAACVLRGIDRSGIDAEGTAVVLGAGSMGLLHLLVLKAVFPNVDVVVVDFDANRLALGVELGAARTAQPGDEATAAVRALTEGIGADAVFDTVGGEKALAAGIALTRAGGSIVLFAHAPDGQSAAVDLNAVFKSERRIIATYSGALREQQRIFDLLVSGALDPTPLVTHTMPLDDFQKGVELAVQRKALKVLFTPSRARGA
jgi:L-iditol 2-dehydrogenase